MVGIVLAIAAVAVVAALIIILVASGVFGGAKGKVEKAFSKTAAAYSDAIREAGLPDLSGLYDSRKVSQSLELELTKINSDAFGSYYYDLSTLEGLGIRYSGNANMPGRQMAVSVTPFYDSTDLLTVQMVVDDANVYLGSPELTRDTFYGVNTQTLGADLDALGADMGDLDELSFNIFDVAEKLEQLGKPDADTEKAVKKAMKELVAAIEVEKLGAETIDVNDYSTACTAYSVVIPQDAMESFLDQIEDTVRDADHMDAYRELLASFGIPEDMLDEMMAELDDAGDYSKEVFDVIGDALDVLGDVELKVYIKNGYVMAVTYDEKLDGTKVEIGVYLGGGKTYVNDLSVVVSLDGGDMEIVLTSSGDHAAKNGAFTDETVLEVSEYGYTVEISSEFSYAAKEKADNFSWSIDLDGVSINMEGQLTAKKDAMTLQLDEVELRTYGSKALVLRVDYAIGPYEKNAAVKSPVMLADITEDDLMDIAGDIEDNAYEWMQDLLDELPELEYLF
ncbi:MAG: hypothetical protein ACI4O3_02470 [Oscillospiraceae bacterium]